MCAWVSEMRKQRRNERKGSARLAIVRRGLKFGSWPTRVGPAQSLPASPRLGVRPNFGATLYTFSTGCMRGEGPRRRPTARPRGCNGPRSTPWATTHPAVRGCDVAGRSKPSQRGALFGCGEHDPAAARGARGPEPCQPGNVNPKPDGLYHSVSSGARPEIQFAILA